MLCTVMFPVFSSAPWCGCGAGDEAQLPGRVASSALHLGLLTATASSHQPTAVPVNKCHGNPVCSRGGGEVGEHQITK